MFNYEPTTVRFQIAWTLLHLAGAAMNIGSAFYHLQRLQSTLSDSPAVERANEIVRNAAKRR